MDNAIFSFPKPINEPVKAYAPGSSEKSSLKKALAQLSSEERNPYRQYRQSRDAA